MKLEKLERLLTTAETWATQLHAGQTYAYDEPYFDAHIVPVVDTVKELTRGVTFTKTERYLAQVVAYLHDIVEDTEVTITEVERTFGTTVAQAVLNLTKLDGESTESQWSRAKRHPLSVVVKKADMLVNLKTSVGTNKPRLIAKYLDGLTYLSL